jgi:hypothetical protein
MENDNLSNPNDSNQTPFKTPDQVAATDDHQSGSPLISTQPIKAHRDNKRIHKYWPPSKKTWLIIIIVVILIAGTSLLIFFNHPKKSVSIKPKKQITQQQPKPLTVASSLTGLQVSPATNQLPITAIMVENSIYARPESGLGEAGVVFEALTEGGISRFVALYQSDKPISVGPVRSARPYFIGWVLGFDAAYAHVGGSPQALNDISLWGVKDLNQFFNGSYYQRISSRQAPHNVYTTLAELHNLELAKGYTSSNFISWPRQAAKPLKNPTVTKINLTLSYSAYNVSYVYDSSTNTYNRYNGGSPQIDADTNKQISVPVVIAIDVPETNGPLDSSNAYYSNYQYIGSGKAYIFQNGGITIGQWSKSSNNSQILFKTNSGQPISLNPGEVWITAITSGSAISYK